MVGCRAVGPVPVISSFMFSPRWLGQRLQARLARSGSPALTPLASERARVLRLLPLPALLGSPALRPSSRRSGLPFLRSSFYPSFSSLRAVWERPPLHPRRMNRIIWISFPGTLECPSPPQLPPLLPASIGLVLSPPRAHVAGTRWMVVPLPSFLPRGQRRHGPNLSASGTFVRPRLFQSPELEVRPTRLAFQC